MSWLAALIPSAAQAIPWLVSNTGVVNSALATINKVYKWIIKKQKSEDVEGSLEELSLPSSIIGEPTTTQQYQFIDRYLSNLAKDKVKTPKQDKTGTASLSGLFPAPVSLTNKGFEQSPEMYKAVGRSLNLQGLGTKLPKGNGIGSKQEKDAAELITSAMCVNVPPPVLHAANQPGAEDGDQPPGVQPTTFQIPDDSDNAKADVCFNGCHCFYRLPLGKVGNADAWHSALVVKQGVSNNAMTEYTNQQRKLTSIESTPSSPNDQWCVTCHISWQTVLAADKFGPQIKPKFGTGDYKEYSMPHSEVNGDLQIVKVRADAKYTPAEIRSVLVRAVKEVLGFFLRVLGFRV